MKAGDPMWTACTSVSVRCSATLCSTAQARARRDCSEASTPTTMVPELGFMAVSSGGYRDRPSWRTVGPRRGLTQDGVALHRVDAGPPAAETPGVARAEQGQGDDGERAEDVVVDHRVRVGRQRHGPHHQVHHGSGGRAEPHGHPEGQREADAEQAEHEEPVDPGRAGDRVVEALEGTLGAEREEALRRVATVDPGGRAEAVRRATGRADSGAEAE